MDGVCTSYRHQGVCVEELEEGQGLDPGVFEVGGDRASSKVDVDGKREVVGGYVDMMVA